MCPVGMKYILVFFCFYEILLALKLFCDQIFGPFEKKRIVLSRNFQGEFKKPIFIIFI